jgi:hypothetical protein
MILEPFKNELIRSSNPVPWNYKSLLINVNPAIDLRIWLPFTIDTYESFKRILLTKVAKYTLYLSKMSESD